MLHLSTLFTVSSVHPSTVCSLNPALSLLTPHHPQSAPSILPTVCSLHLTHSLLSLSWLQSAQSALSTTLTVSSLYPAPSHLPSPYPQFARSILHLVYTCTPSPSPKSALFILSTVCTALSTSLIVRSLYPAPSQLSPPYPQSALSILHPVYTCAPSTSLTVCSIHLAPSLLPSTHPLCQLLHPAPSLLT